VDILCSTLIYIPAPILTIIVCVSLSAIDGSQDLKLSAAWVVLPHLNFFLCLYSLLVSLFKFANICLSFIVHLLTWNPYTNCVVLAPVWQSGVFYSGFIYSQLFSTPYVHCCWGGSYVKVAVFWNVPLDSAAGNSQFIAWKKRFRMNLQFIREMWFGKSFYN
jgi:hypothetical protein